MKKVVLSNDYETQNKLKKSCQSFIFPKDVQDGICYAFYDGFDFWFITKIKEKEYRIVNLFVKKSYCDQYFKVLRGAVKHCLKKGEEVYQIEDTNQLNYFIKYV